MTLVAGRANNVLIAFQHKAHVIARLLDSLPKGTVIQLWFHVSIRLAVVSYG